MFALKDVANYPRPATTSPGLIRFAPDNRSIYYLANADGGATTARQLYAHDLTTFDKTQLITPPSSDTEANLSLEEKLRRERARQLSTGVTSYQVSSKSSTKYVLIPLQGSLYVQDLDDSSPGSKSLRCIFDKTSTGVSGGAIDSCLSPDGSRVAFVQENEIYIVAITSAGTPASPAVQVTTGARGNGKTNGLADFIAQEEMDRYRGFWWSPCSTYICFEQVEEGHIPKYNIMHQGKETVVSESHHYPFAGKINPKVELGVINVGSATAFSESKTSTSCWNPSSTSSSSPDFPAVAWMSLSTVFPDKNDIYLARVHWNATRVSKTPLLMVELENRAQTTISMVHYNIATGAGRVLYTEHNDCWINLHHLFYGYSTASASASASASTGATNETKDEDDNNMSFVFGSEKKGFMHLYRFDWNVVETGLATMSEQLTTGTLIAESIVCVSPQKNVVLFMGTDTEEAPLERHLYSVPLRSPSSSSSSTASNMQPIKLTQTSGVHRVTVNHTLDRAIDVFSSIDTPPTVTLCSLSLASTSTNQLTAEKQLYSAVLPERLTPYIRPPELNEFKGPSGHRLHYALFKPDPNKYGTGPYPLIVEVYGGPHVMRVQNSWNILTAGSTRAQYLCSQGFLVAKCDNRGSARRGTEFEFQLHKRMGTVECDDQVALVKHLTEERTIGDKTNVGVYGWSYGGYMSAMLLCKAPDVFHAAVSGAPVTHWDGYDTHYTERYMQTPQTNPDGYDEGSVMKHVAKMKGKLMLVHGLIDENVHFRHTARLINRLIATRKVYDLLLFPEERHSPRRLGDRIYMEERISSFFNTHLNTKK